MESQQGFTGNNQMIVEKKKMQQKFQVNIYNLTK